MIFSIFDNKINMSREQLNYEPVMIIKIKLNYYYLFIYFLLSAILIFVIL
jgi:hypothetical protein